jgi:hypothetical protein
MNPATKAMELKDWYAPSNWYWLRKRDLDMNVTGPVFDYKGKEYTVQSSKECRIWLLDTSALGGENHQHAGLPHTALLQRGSEFHDGGVGRAGLWEDVNRTRWVLSPFWGPKHPQFKAPIEHGTVTYGAVVAYKMEDRAGSRC